MKTIKLRLSPPSSFDITASLAALKTNTAAIYRRAQAKWMPINLERLFNLTPDGVDTV